MAVYGPAFPDHRLREGVPNLCRIAGLHAHRFHLSVEEAFSFWGENPSSRRGRLGQRRFTAYAIGSSSPWGRLHRLLYSPVKEA